MAAKGRQVISRIIRSKISERVSKGFARRKYSENKKEDERCLKKFVLSMIAIIIMATVNVVVAGADDKIIKIDGSSTVYPITEAVAEEFQKAKKGAVKVTVGISGTGGGFKKFCREKQTYQTHQGLYSKKRWMYARNTASSMWSCRWHLTP